MTIEEIKAAKSNLEMEVHAAAARMELGTALRDAQKRLKELQFICPHAEGTFDYNNSGICPICGKKWE